MEETVETTGTTTKKRSKKVLATAAAGQARYRERKKFAADFDQERVKRQLISPFETAPFVDVTTCEEQLLVSRKFAHAFRQAGEYCPDIQDGETVNDFAWRILKLWYLDLSEGRTARFLNLRSGRLDREMGFARDTSITFDDWVVLPGADQPVDVAALRMLGAEKAEWREQGFDSWHEWREWQVKDEAEKKFREIVIQSVVDQQAEAAKPEPKQALGIFSAQICDGN